MAQQQKTITLDFDKDTKNTRKFTEPGEREDHTIGSAYIKHSILQGAEPDSIEMVISWEDGKVAKPVSKARLKKAAKKRKPAMAK